MVARRRAPPGRRPRAARGGGRVGARRRRPQARAARLPAQRAGDPAVRARSASSARATASEHYRRGARVRGRDPDGVRDSGLIGCDALLVARDLAVPRGAVAHLALARRAPRRPARAARRAGRSRARSERSSSSSCLSSCPKSTRAASWNESGVASSAGLVDLARPRRPRPAGGTPRASARSRPRSAPSSSSSSGSTSAVRYDAARRSARRPGSGSRPSTRTFIRPSSKVCDQLDHAGAACRPARSPSSSSRISPNSLPSARHSPISSL